MKNDSRSDLFTTFPNPNNGKFTIETAPGKNYQLEIRNFLGELIYKTSLTGGKTEFSLDELMPKGTYMIRLSNTSVSAVRKLIIQ